MTHTPTRIEPYSEREILVDWTGHESYIVPYFELRFLCPCAVCVDEMTGKRTLKREAVPSDVKPKAVEPVGQYAIRIAWSDAHRTGIYHFETLYEICTKAGIRQ